MSVPRGMSFLVKVDDVRADYDAIFSPEYFDFGPLQALVPDPKIFDAIVDLIDRWIASDQAETDKQLNKSRFMGLVWSHRLPQYPDHRKTICRGHRKRIKKAGGSWIWSGAVDINLKTGDSRWHVPGTPVGESDSY